MTNVDSYTPWFPSVFKDIAWTLFTVFHGTACKFTEILMSEAYFKIRLGRISAPDGHRKFIRLARHLRFGASRIPSKSGLGARRSSRPSAQYFQRRVIVKFSLVKMTAQGKLRQAQHLDYIARETAGPERNVDIDQAPEKDGQLFDPRGRDVDVEAFTERGADDPHQFRIIVSPEDSHRLESLEDYTRNLMRQMERDLCTKLDWVGAVHYDTAHPHAHIVLRGMKDNGHRLIIPRRYIAHGLREQAERLVSLELGPMPVKEAGLKLARQVTQEKLTGLDRALMRASENGIIEMGALPNPGEAWTRRLDMARLKFLSKMGLAEKLSASQWKLDPGLEKTLRALGERVDILKAYHKAMKDSQLVRNNLGDVIYEPDAPDAKSITGRVIKTGILDDVNDRAFAVIDDVSGQALFVPMGGGNNLEDMNRGDIVCLTPNRYAPKPSDMNIENVASRNGRIYDMASHMKFDDSARPSFLEAHVRRLEALRRAGIVTRLENGGWSIPGDFLSRVEDHESRKLAGRPVKVTVLARGRLNALSTTMGVTWLDRELVGPSCESGRTGFGLEMRQALEARRQFLSNAGILQDGRTMDQSHLSELEKRDLQGAAKDLEKSLGKSFTPLPERGTITGQYIKRIDRPSGQYAVIERAKEFSLVPWRDVMEKRRGMEISGQIRAGRINWQFGRQRGMEFR